MTRVAFLTPDGANFSWLAVVTERVQGDCQEVVSCGCAVWGSV